MLPRNSLNNFTTLDTYTQRVYRQSLNTLQVTETQKLTYSIVSAFAQATGLAIATIARLCGAVGHTTCGKIK